MTRDGLHDARKSPVERCLRATLSESLPPAYAAPVGGVAEWFNAPVLKTDVGVTLPWVRIPPPPPLAPGAGSQGSGLVRRSVGSGGQAAFGGDFGDLGAIGLGGAGQQFDRTVRRVLEGFKHQVGA